MTERIPHGLFILLALLLAALAVWGTRRWLKARRRARLRAEPLAPDRRAILERGLPVYASMPDALRARLDGLVNQFLDEIRFYGAGGLAVTEEMRTLIAAQAAMLVVGRPGRWFETLSTIHIYPSAFASTRAARHGAFVTEKKTARSGESWRRGPVVLSWRDAAHGAADPYDARNVVYHEFAHQLDQQSGVMDGAPLLAKDQSASGWARAFQDAYGRMNAALAAGRETFMNPYGATAPAEFFAVAVEYFFEQPAALKREEPALYAELSHYFALDPAGWG
ncbi:MAG: zinc-dependent peptidase [Parvularculaceae bacterium]